MTLFSQWFKPLSSPVCYGLIVTIRIHNSIYGQKLAAERKYCQYCPETCSKCQKLSLEREVLRKVWTIFRRHIAKRISGNLAVEPILKFTVFSKLKTEKHFNRQV